MQKIIDLTHTLRSTIPTWEGDCGFRLQDTHVKEVCVQKYEAYCGAGTHIDAPLHFFPDGQDSASLEITIAPLHIIERKDGKPITLHNIEEYEKLHGPILEGSIVVASTGWSQYWNDPDRYRGVKGHPPFPTFSPLCIPLLLERRIAGIGIDTLSPDSSDSHFEVHKAILGSGMFIIENLTNLDQCPAVGAKIGNFPLKIEGGSESPARVIAFVPA
jgi:kynurenine formamidase